ncbi:unnamed protein product [Gongylonema pulchrum]|uniref:Uncharacterized protein n=1 Tax=Gongylonema pulchrum TaxID=637853 RepID=A0A3P6QC93_9BILA|nr:unnamed protein product [Gongylonema pulchrum]
MVIFVGFQVLADEDTRETIDLMHRMTRTATTHPAPPPVHDPSLVVTDITRPERTVKEDEEEEEEEVRSNVSPVENKPVSLLKQSKYPALNQMLGNCSYVKLRSSHQALLRCRIDAVVKQITSLRASAMNCFYARIEELGIEASTPSLLLENAKEIVAHHKKITAECAALESEITALEMSNQQLELKVRRRDELDSAKSVNNSGALSDANSQLLSSLCAANSLILAENFQALAAHNKSLLNRVAQLVEKSDTVGTESGNLGTATQDGLLSPQSEDNTVLAFSSAPGAFGRRTPPQTSTVSLSASSTPMKRSRQRQVRGGVLNKKPLSGSNKQPTDPIEDEEMERKIQDIVAKALEVDSAAKCAEKERRARGEKRKEKCTLAGVRSATDVVISTDKPATLSSASLPPSVSTEGSGIEAEIRIPCTVSSALI